jgi:hypothetical protein
MLIIGSGGMMKNGKFIPALQRGIKEENRN